MILLYRYILAHFIRNLGLIMASFISIYLLIDFFEKIDNFLEKGKSFELIAKFFLLNIPFIIDMMSPVCILLAGVVTLGVLNHSNELIALKACGIPLKKIIAADHRRGHGLHPAFSRHGATGAAHNNCRHQPHLEP
jgi:lipopolysaccharide export system permease protein